MSRLIGVMTGQVFALPIIPQTNRPHRFSFSFFVFGKPVFLSKIIANSDIFRQQVLQISDLGFSLKLSYNKRETLLVVDVSATSTFLLNARTL